MKQRVTYSRTFSIVEYSVRQAYTEGTMKLMHECVISAGNSMAQEASSDVQDFEDWVKWTAGKGLVDVMKEYVHHNTLPANIKIDDFLQMLQRPDLQALYVESTRTLDGFIQFQREFEILLHIEANRLSFVGRMKNIALRIWHNVR